MSVVHPVRHVIEQLQDQYSWVLFYNPNVHPVDEHDERLAEMRAYSTKTMWCFMKVTTT